VPALASRPKASDPQFRVRRNDIYAGISDGLTAYLRGRFSAQSNVGIALEINQKYVYPKIGT
jgi:hypothetical protein